MSPRVLPTYVLNQSSCTAKNDFETENGARALVASTGNREDEFFGSFGGIASGVHFKLF